MTLTELTEPFFQYICRLNRWAHGGGQLDVELVRAEIKGLLADMKAKSAATAGLAGQYEKIELPLIFFADFMVKEGNYTISKKWKELAFDRNELGGDEKFFDLLEETLKDPSPAANERLAVFYTCLGLGFTGWYAGQPEFLRKKSREIRLRLDAGSQDSDSRKICPDSYDHVNTADLIEPPGVKLVGIAVVLVVCIITLVVANFYLFHRSVSQLNQALTMVLQHKSHGSNMVSVPTQVQEK